MSPYETSFSQYLLAGNFFIVVLIGKTADGKERKIAIDVFSNDKEDLILE